MPARISSSEWVDQVLGRAGAAETPRSKVMANPEHLAILKEGLVVWNRWRQESRVSPDLSEADLCRPVGRGLLTRLGKGGR
jgi:hypothetical protein